MNTWLVVIVIILLVLLLLWLIHLQQVQIASTIANHAIAKDPQAQKAMNQWINARSVRSSNY